MRGKEGTRWRCPFNCPRDPSSLTQPVPVGSLLPSSPASEKPRGDASKTASGRGRKTGGFRRGEPSKKLTGVFPKLRLGGIYPVNRPVSQPTDWLACQPAFLATFFLAIMLAGRRDGLLSCHNGRLLAGQQSCLPACTHAVTPECWSTFLQACNLDCSAANRQACFLAGMLARYLDCLPPCRHDCLMVDQQPCLPGYCPTGTPA